MGYNVKIIESTAFIPNENLEKAYDVMCALNTTHHHLKRGGSFGRGHENKWFSWMHADYPSRCIHASEILKMLGFETTETVIGLKIIDYDSKTGQENLFLESIKYLAIGYIKWRAEDDEEWITQFYGDSVIKHSDTLKTLIKLT